MSTTLRVPLEVSKSARQIAALRGCSPGEVIAEAWRDYLAENREEFAADLEKAAELVRQGDTEGLARHTSRNAETRGKALAGQARRRRRTS